MPGPVAVAVAASSRRRRSRSRGVVERRHTELNRTCACIGRLALGKTYTC